MRVLLFATTAVIALGATITVLPSRAEDAPKLQTSPVATPHDENQKANEALSNPPQAGRTEPSATNAAGANQAADGKKPDPVFVDGALNVPGAPQDSQSRPAKFSRKNDSLDHTPILAQPLGLTDEQKQGILQAVAAAKAPVQQISAKPTDELPFQVALHELPAATHDPRLGGLKYVQTLNSILLVRADNRVVIAEIKK